MINAYSYGCIFLFVCIGFLKALQLEDVPIDDNNSAEKIDEGTIFRNLEDITVADVYDDYMKVILFDGIQFRGSIQNKGKLWDNGIVPYVISDKYSRENRDFILKSMNDFHNKTCIKFQQRKREASYIMLVPGSGCNAIIGKVQNSSNRINLHENCFVRGIVLHELMHALGFIHEQNRPDRDEFVEIVFENIKSGLEKNFEKYKEGELQLFNQEYDYESLMHYGSHDFAKDKHKPTIIPLKKGVAIGQRKGFSEKDVIKINLLYNCTDAQNSTENTENIRAAAEERDVLEQVTPLIETPLPPDNINYGKGEKEEKENPSENKESSKNGKNILHYILKIL